MSSDIEKAILAAPPDGAPTSVSHGEAPARLRGNMGVLHLVFTVLAFNAPLGAIAGMVPLVVAMGGVASPLIYIGYGLLMAVFAVGYTAMAARLPRAGAFYTYVTAGLGRPMGLSAGFVALFSYTVSLLGVLPFVGMALQSLVVSYNGPSIPWWVWVFVFVATVGVLGVLRVDFSARVLGVLVAIEVVVVLVFDFAVGGTGGKTGHLTFGSFHPGSLWAGGAVVALVFVVGSFVGFESTAVFRDEVRDPQRTVPRATYLALAAIALFFSFASWLLIQAYGETDATSAMANDPANAFMNSVREYAGAAMGDIATALMVTSVFASCVALHNIISRYMFVLAVDGILPRSVAVPHPRFGSPHRASAALSAGTLLFFVVVVIAKLDPEKLYSKFMGLAGFGMVFLMCLAAIAIAIYLVRTPPSDINVWRRLIAPILAAVALVGVFVAVASKLDYLTGARSLSVAAVVLVAGCVVAGCSVALVLRSRRPDVYRHIGTRE